MFDLAFYRSIQIALNVLLNPLVKASNYCSYFETLMMKRDNPSNKLNNHFEITSFETDDEFKYYMSDYMRYYDLSVNPSHQNYNNVKWYSQI